METLRVKFIVWWRVNISGELHLGTFLRFVMREPLEDTLSGAPEA
jgi:hypothetical protein